MVRYGVMVEIELHFDGSCWPNPGGKAGYGCTIEYPNLKNSKDLQGIIGSGSQYSNNYAELYAALKGLEEIHKYVKEFPNNYLIKVVGDSQLALNLMSGRFKGKSSMLYYPALLMVREEIESLKETGTSISYRWVPRELNKKADSLSR